VHRVRAFVVYPAAMHTFPVTLRWSGPTDGEPYARGGEAGAPGKPPIGFSAAPAFLGDGGRWNPEDLLGASLAACHLLSFLALCERAGLPLRGYEDRAEVALGTVRKVTSVTEIRLRPRVRIAAGADADEAAELCRRAARYCFIGNSLQARVVVEPEVTVEGEAKDEAGAG
jgi:organic hydroperoxide reductase OsmC/OhrA